MNGFQARQLYRTLHAVLGSSLDMAAGEKLPSGPELGDLSNWEEKEAAQKVAEFFRAFAGALELES